MPATSRCAPEKLLPRHGGTAMGDGLLKQLLPPATVEYVEKQPTLEDVFLSIVGDDGTDNNADRHSVGTDQ